MALVFKALKKRVTGTLLIALGAFALSAPLAVGQWSLALLGIPLMVLSVTEAYAAFISPRRTEVSAYVPSVLAMFAGNLLLLSSALVVNGLLILLFSILVLDGLGKIITVWRKPPKELAPDFLNAVVDFASAALLWYLSRTVGAERA